MASDGTPVTETDAIQWFFPAEVTNTISSDMPTFGRPEYTLHFFSALPLEAEVELLSKPLDSPT